MSSTPERRDGETPATPEAGFSILGALSAIGGAIRHGAGVALEAAYRMNLPAIPDELRGMLTEADMDVISEAYYKDIRADYCRTVTTKEPHTIEHADGNFTVGELQVTRNKVDPSVLTLGGLRGEERLVAIIKIYGILDYDNLDPHVRSKLDGYLMDRFCTKPYTA